MNKFFLRKTCLIMSGVLMAGTSCSGDKSEKQSEKMPKQQMEEKSSEEKGPEQQPFKKCDATDAECEEGASNDALRKTEDTLHVEALEESKEQVLFVTPIVIEAVKIQLPNEESAAIAQDSAKEEKVAETASAESPAAE